jgi:hypothetical protein
MAPAPTPADAHQGLLARSAAVVITTVPLTTRQVVRCESKGESKSSARRVRWSSSRTCFSSPTQGPAGEGEGLTRGAFRQQFLRADVAVSRSSSLRVG